MLLRPRPDRRAAALGAWALLVAVSVVWGRSLLPDGGLNLGSPPFQGVYRLSVRAVLPGAALAVVLIAVLPRLARSMRWHPLLVTCWLLAAGWAVSLAVWDGHPSIGRPIDRPREYLAALPAVGDDPLGFLRGFTEHLPSYPVHVTGHPPLMVLVFWAWAHLGLSGGTWAAALVIAAGASTVPAVAVTLRAVAGESSARAALPFLVLAPFAITVATSADAFFAGVAAWSVAGFAVGVRDGSARWLAVGGLLAGALPYLSYGLLPFGLLPLAAGWLAGRRGHSSSRAGVAAAVGGLLVVPVLMTAGGFWWPDGVAGTHRAWVAGRGDDRPYVYSFLADLAILAVLAGPATAAGLASRPRRAVAVLAGAAVAAVLVLDLSGVTRLEVERIWLPFAPWVVVGCAALRRHRRTWLAANALCALTFTLLVRDVW